MTIDFTVFKGSASGQITKSTTSLPDLAPNQVLLENTHSGVCGTDSHFKHADMVLGHEGVGVAKAVGSEVKNIKVGDRLGFGYVKDGCGECIHCKSGYTWHCSVAGRAYGSTDKDQGSFATHSVWPSTRLIKIPDAIASEDAGPFMCGGQTVFVPIIRNQIKKGERVGVIGIGGLGHLAIQFAAAWGAEVAVFSSTDSKKEEALGFGATEFHNTKDIKAEEVGKLNHLFVTTSAQPDWELYADLMAPFGKIYPLTIALGEKFVFPYQDLVLKELSIKGSCSSSLDEVKAMLDFIVEHKIKPAVQTFPMSEEGITEALDKLEAGEIRYRGVLVV